MLGGTGARPAPHREERLARVHELFPILAERAEQRAGTLSGGEQQMLALGRALMSGPQLLLLDEPSLGLAPVVVDTLFDALEEIHASGVSILLVEQNVTPRARDLRARLPAERRRDRPLRRGGGAMLEDPEVQRICLVSDVALTWGGRGLRRRRVVPRRLPAVVDDVAADDREHRLRQAHVRVADGQVVAVEDDEVAELADLDRAELVLACSCTRRRRGSSRAAPRRG